MRVYVAGPYSSDPVIGTRNAIRAGDILWSNGHYPFIPHLTHFWHFLIPHDYSEWLAYDIEWLKQCDALVRLTGESGGADEEVLTAVTLGIPVYYGVEAFLNA